MHALLIATILSAQAPPLRPLGPGSPAPIAFEQRGLQVGEKIPPVDLVDQQGRRRSLRDLSGPKGLVLLFVRSADW